MIDYTAGSNQFLISLESLLNGRQITEPITADQIGSGVIGAISDTSGLEIFYDKVNG